MRRSRPAEPAVETAPSVRLANRTAVEGDWIDPDDNNQNRRLARRVRGTRAMDPIRAAANRGGSLLQERHAMAADRYLETYEVGLLGVRMGERSEVHGGNFACWPT